MKYKKNVKLGRIKNKVLLLNAVAFAIFKGKVGIIKMLNRSFIKTFGYRPNELHDVEDWWRVAYPNPTYREQVQKMWFERFDVAKKTHQPFKSMEAMVRCRDGSERYIRFHAILIGSFNLVAFERIIEQQLGTEAQIFIRLGKSIIINSKFIYYVNVSKQQIILADISFPNQFDLEASREALKALKTVLEESTKSRRIGL